MSEWKLNVTKPLPGVAFTLKELKNRLSDAIVDHNGRPPGAIMITEQQQKYLSSGLGAVPWNKYRDIPLEMVK